MSFAHNRNIYTERQTKDSLSHTLRNTHLKETEDLSSKGAYFSLDKESGFLVSFSVVFTHSTLGYVVPHF